MWIHTTFLFLLIGALSGLSQDGYLDKSIRNSRAANVTSVLPLRTILENLAVLARVTNAVSLTAALLQKTFPFRTIIGEIMETEPSVVGEIAKHDPSQINSHLHRMLNRYTFITEATNQYGSTLPKLIDICEQFEKTIGIRSSFSNETFVNFFNTVLDPQLKKYSNPCDVNLMMLLQTFWKVMNGHSGSVEEQQKDTILQMKENISNIQNCVVSIKDSYGRITTLLSSPKFVLQQVKSMRDVMKKLQGKELHNLEDNVKTFQKTFQEVRNIWKTPEVNVHVEINKILDSRNKTKSSNFDDWVYSTGFSARGDYLKIKNDLKGKWFKDEVSMGRNTDFLEKALEKFITLGEIISNFEKAWLNFDKQIEANFSKIDNITSLFSTTESFKNVNSSETNIKKMEDTLRNCSMFEKTIDGPFDEMDNQLHMIHEMVDSLYEIRDWCLGTSRIDTDLVNAGLDSLEKLDKINLLPMNLEELKETFRKTPNFDEINEFTKTFMELRTLQDKFEENFKNMNETLAHGQCRWNDLNKSPLFISLQCLKDTHSNSENWKEKIAMQLLNSSVSGYIRMKQSFITAETFLRNIPEPNVSTGRTNPVFKLKNGQKLSKILGLGVINLAQIVTALNNKIELLKSTNYSKEVDDEISKHNPSNEVRQFWSTEYKTTIRKMIEEMDNLNHFANEILNKDLMTQRQIFEKSATINGIRDAAEILRNVFEKVWNQLMKLNSVKKDFKEAVENSKHLTDRIYDLNFVRYQGELHAASGVIQEVKAYFDEIFGLLPQKNKKKTDAEKVVNNAYLTVILISVAIFLIVLIGIISIYGLTSSGRRNFAIWYLYYFGKPENFENRWRYSLFLDRKDGENGLLGAVRESNKAHALKFIKKGAFINAYNHHGNTLLHSATKLGKVELVEILIKNGADLTLLNAKNKTAEEILVSETKLAHGDKKEQFETIGLIYKKYGKKKFRIQVPEIFPVSSFHIFIDKETDDNVTNKFLLVFQSITSMEPLPNTTHCIVQTEFDGTLKTNDLDLLIWILNGIIFVKESWMTDCLDNEKLIKRDCEYLVEKVKYKNTVYNTVLQWSEAMAKSTMPYLYGAHVVISMKKCENCNVS